MKLYNTIFFFLAFALGGSVQVAGAQGVGAVDSARAMFERMQASSDLKGATLAVKVCNLKGETLLEHNGGSLLVPASVMKTVSTGEALLVLRPEYRFETSLAIDGKINEAGQLEGNVYMVGGADPTLASRRNFRPSITQVFASFKAALDKAGIKSVKGSVVGDGRFFTAPMECDSWQWYDTGTYYGAGASGLMFHENKRDFNVSPGSAPGQPVRFDLVYPPLHGLNIDFQAKTGEKGSGNSLYLITTTLSSKAEFRGTFAIDRRTKTEETANKFPAHTASCEFTNYLISHGINVEGEPRDAGNSFDAAVLFPTSSSDSLKVLHVSRSEPLAKIASETLHHSNNLFADTFLRYSGKMLSGSDDYSTSSKTLLKVLKDSLHISSSHIQIADGSGLSRQNLLSAEFLCDYLAAMVQTSVFDAFLGAFPSPGGGTVSDLSSNSSCSVLFIKSGSMNAVRCYVGYAIPKSLVSEAGPMNIASIAREHPDQVKVFCIMANGFTCPSSRVTSRMYSFMQAL